MSPEVETLGPSHIHPRKTRVSLESFIPPGLTASPPGAGSQQPPRTRRRAVGVHQEHVRGLRLVAGGQVPSRLHSVLA